MTTNLNKIEHDAISMASHGCISGTSAEWPVLVGALRKLGYDLPTTATAQQVLGTIADALCHIDATHPDFPLLRSKYAKTCHAPC